MTDEKDHSEEIVIDLKKTKSWLNQLFICRITTPCTEKNMIKLEWSDEMHQTFKPYVCDIVFTMC